LPNKIFEKKFGWGIVGIKSGCIFAAALGMRVVLTGVSWDLTGGCLVLGMGRWMFGFLFLDRAVDVVWELGSEKKLQKKIQKNLVD
jgi:hypothetical protein